MKRTPLRRMSKAKAKETRRYRLLKDQLLPRSCEFNGCVRLGTQIHHIKGRIGSLLTDRRYLIVICHEHHTWIHSHMKEARKLGLILYK